MVSFPPQVIPQPPYGIQPQGGSDPQKMHNLKRAQDLMSACNSCGSCAGCGGGGANPANIMQIAEQGGSPDAAFESFKKQRYQEIYQHESAHQSAAGAFGGGINIEYGANGIPVGGHVNVQMPGSVDEQNPESTVKHAETVRRAALAPSDPSGQDLSVASQAQSILGKAQVMMQRKQAREQQGVPVAGQVGVSYGLQQQPFIPKPQRVF